MALRIFSRLMDSLCAAKRVTISLGNFRRLGWIGRRGLHRLRAGKHETKDAARRLQTLPLFAVRCAPARCAAAAAAAAERRCLPGWLARRASASASGLVRRFAPLLGTDIPG